MSQRPRRSRVHRSFDPTRAKGADRLAYALALHKAGKYVEAGEIYQELESRYAPHWHARFLGAMLAHTAGETDRAIALLEEVTLNKPRWADAWYNLGTIYQEQGRITDAERRYRRALACDARHASTWVNLGNARLAQGDADEAVRCFHRAIDLKPTEPEARVNLSHALLTMGRWAEGWPMYEHRWLAPGFLARNGLSRKVQNWTGSEPLDGRHVLAFAEQGMGDTLHFVRYVPLLQARGARVTVRCQRPLVLLLQASYPGVAVIADDEPIPEADYCVPLMSLPLHFGTTPETVPFAEGYLWRPPTLLAPHGARVGLVWAGNPNHKNDKNRSASLAAMAPLFEVPGIAWTSLQVGARADEAPDVMRRVAPRDYADTAAVLASLDLVIGVDTSVIHLAGALGVRCWALLAAVPDFRWMLGRDDTPWYRSVRLYRQPTMGDWAAVIARVKDDLVAETRR